MKTDPYIYQIWTQNWIHIFTGDQKMAPISKIGYLKRWRPIYLPKLRFEKGSFIYQRGENWTLFRGTSPIHLVTWVPRGNFNSVGMFGHMTTFRWAIMWQVGHIRCSSWAWVVVFRSRWHCGFCEFGQFHLKSLLNYGDLQTFESQYHNQTCHRHPLNVDNNAQRCTIFTLQRGYTFCIFTFAQTSLKWILKTQW